MGSGVRNLGITVKLGRKDSGDGIWEQDGRRNCAVGIHIVNLQAYVGHLKYWANMETLKLSHPPHPLSFLEMTCFLLEVSDIISDALVCCWFPTANIPIEAKAMHGVVDMQVALVRKERNKGCATCSKNLISLCCPYLSAMAMAFFVHQ